MRATKKSKAPPKPEPKTTVSGALMERLGQIGTVGEVASSVGAVANMVRGDGVHTWAKVLGGLALTVICTPPALLPARLAGDTVKAVATAAFAASQVFGKKTVKKSFDFIEAAGEVVDRAKKVKRALEPEPEDEDSEEDEE
jgi:hypothetical protein